MAQTRILVADDDQVSLHLLRSALGGWGYEVITAQDGAEALVHLQAPRAPRLAIVDWMMPGLDGPTLCRRLRDAQQAQYAYVLLLTARTDTADLVQGLDAGADDYLRKPVDFAELRARLRAGERIVQLQSQLLEAQEQLRLQATTDSLTGLLGRRALLERLEVETARRVREKTPMSLVLLDVDEFKKVNDAHGHLVGDEVLREVAARLRSTLRPYDLLGRFGGEEFVAALPGCPEAGARSVGERLRRAIVERPIDTTKGPLRVTISVGISLDRGTGASALLEAADVALYRAKRAGRNAVELYEPSPRHAVSRPP